MLYIFDLANVIVDIDFNRVLGVWSDLSRVPLATLQNRFAMDESFQQHERGEISDQVFAEKMCEKLDLALGFEQFTVGWLAGWLAGWQAVFVGVRSDVIDIMQALRAQGERVVILSNTNNLHCEFWPSRYPEVINAADHIYLSQEMGMRKPEAEIYQQVLQREKVLPQDVFFFDDNEENIRGATALGIKSVLVSDSGIVPAFFAGKLNK